MAVIMSLDEALEDIKAKEKDNGELIVNRFNKKKFETLLLALANDLNFTTEVVKVKNQEKMTETVEVTKKFRKFCKCYFKRVNKQLSKESTDGWLKYHLSGIKNPLAVYAELGGIIEYDCKRKSLIKTFLQAIRNFFKVLWNFYKTLMRKIIYSLKPVKVSYYLMIKKRRRNFSILLFF